MKKPIGLVLFCALSLFSYSAVGAEATYVTSDMVDLTKLLAPPPALQSEEQKRDIAEVLAVQRSRTPARTKRAVADIRAGTFGFADVLGPNFATEHLPKMAALFEKIRGDAAVAFSAGKDAWNRPRPFTTSKLVHPVGDLPGGSSYPSGYATNGYLTAIILADMVPEKSTALFARGREFGDDRIVLGLHYPSDVEAGRFAAIALATALLQNRAFMKDFAEAKAELRQVLNLQ